MESRAAELQGIEVWGHRGAAGLAPENTVPSFRLAAELGCHGIECDVHAVEGQLVVIHDRTVDRTTDGRGSLRKLGLARLRHLDAGGAPIPLLPDLLSVLRDFPSLSCNIELKDTASAPLLQAALEAWPPRVTERLLVSSFRVPALEPWRGHPVPRALCADRPGRSALAACRRLGCAALHLSLAGAKASAVRPALAEGFAVRVYTVNDPARLEGLGELGVCGVFTDRPDLLLGVRP